MKKILLGFPPNYTYKLPSLALPMLTGFLKERGIETIQQDYKIEYLLYWERLIFKENKFSLSTQPFEGERYHV